MLKLQLISLRYPQQQAYLLKDLSLDFCPGELCVLTGSNGCGKTSLLNIICGIIPTSSDAEFSGQVLYGAQDITRLSLSERFHYLSIQMADPDTQFFFPSGVHELSFPPENLGLPASVIKARMEQISAFFELGALLESDAAKLSTGQQKTLLWAICDIIDAPIVLLDEPCSGISAAKLELLFRWIDALKSKGKIVIAAEHDQNLISRADRNIDMDAFSVARKLDV